MPTRALVVEDSVTVRRFLVERLSADPEIEVVAEASDGKEAIRLCEALRPDVVTLDMMLPVMSGLAATEYIMAHCPTPILIVSSSMNRGEVFKTYEALAAGAVDVLDKPADGVGLHEWGATFAATVKLVARIRVITHVRARLRLQAPDGALAAPPRADAAAPAVPGRADRRPVVVAIGASTGGPGAILAILRALPPGFPVPILLILHLSEPFADAFAEWLDGQTGFRAVYATNGAAIAGRAGTVILGPPGRHFVVRHGRGHLTLGPERHGCRPAVDTLFESVAAEYGPAAVACLLTGMGRDGAAGLLAVRQAGGMTIAQDEATSIVYGMPREAARIGAAARVLPLEAIGPALRDLVSAPGTRVAP